MTFLQVLAARLLAASGKRKRQMMIAGVVGRSLWLVIALAPLVAPHFGIGRGKVLWVVMGCIVFSGAFQSFNTPAFFSWMTDLVPARVRPLFFARRMQIGTVVSLLTVLLAGFVADEWPTLTTYSIILALAAVFGLLDIILFIGVREPPHSETSKPSAATPSLIQTIREPLSDVPTRRFLAFLSILMFANGLQAPFVWLHASEYLHLSKTLTGVLLTVIPLCAMAMSLRFWGDVIKRFGNRPVMRFCSMGIAFTGMGWLIARPGAWDLLPVLFFFSGVLGGAIDLSSQNIITGLSPHIPRGSMSAMFSICAGLSFAAASWIGGALAESLHWMNEGQVMLWGMKLANYHVLFAITVVIRMLNATFVAPLLHEPEATGTVDTMKEVVPEIAQAFAARFTRPLGVREE
jgi:MFS family permease